MRLLSGCEWHDTRDDSLNRDEAVAIGLTWLKGPRNKPYLEVARALDYLRKLPEFQTNRDLGRFFGVSGEIVREFLSLLTLPDNIQRMVEEHKLRLDQGTKLASLFGRNPLKAGETADVLAGVPAEDARHIIDYVLRNPSKSASEAKRQVFDSKTRIEDEFHVVAVVTSDEFRRVRAHAQRRGISPSGLVGDIVRRWLQEQG